MPYMLDNLDMAHRNMDSQEDEYEVGIPVEAMLRVTVYAKSEDEALEIALKQYKNAVSFNRHKLDEFEIGEVAEDGYVERL